MSRYAQRHAHRQMDEASLQTDVMRFMAIVAFCLVAILAVVRNVDAPPELKPVETVTAVVQDAAEPEPATPPTPATKLPEPAPLPEPEFLSALEPVAKNEGTPVAESQPQAQPQPDPGPEPETEVFAEPVADIPDRSTPIVREENPSPPVEAPREPPEPGLSLRFVSNQDFLRLVNRGAVQVLAFKNSDYYILNSAYRFVASKPPRQFHELDASTIPPLLKQTLAESMRAEDDWQWGVVLPSGISQQIQTHLRANRHGELRIDRYERVHHVQPS